MDENAKISSLLQSIAAVATSLALVFALINTFQTGKNLELSQRTFLEEYEEFVSLSGELMLSRNSDFQYWRTDTGDTLQTTLPLATSFVLINNSRSSIAIENIDYLLFESVRDSIPLYYPRNYIRRGSETDSLPITIGPLESVFIQDSIEVVLPFSLSPFNFYNDSTAWKSWPARLMIKNMIESSYYRRYGYSGESLVKSIDFMNDVTQSFDHFLRIVVTTSRGKSYILDYSYLRGTESAGNVHSDSTTIREITPH